MAAARFTSVICAFFLLLGMTPLGTAAPSRSRPAAAAPAGHVVRASEAGARLDAHLMRGGGTDDTAVLQSILDRAATGDRVYLLIDGVALVSGLNVYGNTTVECTSGGGLYLKDKSSRAILRNAHRSRDAILDEHITIRGCFFNGNRAQQPGAHPEREPQGNNQLADGSFITGIEFLGVNYLAVHDVTLWNIRSFGALIGNASRIDIRNVTVDHGGGPDIDWEYLQTDGLHFKGPLQYVTIDGLKLRTGDDALAFNADDMLTDDLTVHNEFGPYVRHGPILDVTVNNVQLMDSLFGIRFLSSRQRIDRVSISNLTGTITGPRLAIISNYMGPSPGNIGTIQFSNVHVTRSRDAKFVARFRNDVVGIKEIHKQGYEENNGGIATFFNINGHVESLSVLNFRTTASDDRPIIRFGPNANILQMALELSLFDPDLRALPMKLDSGAHVGQLRFLLDWSSRQGDIGKSPIADLGGNIEELRWDDTPPRYVDATLTSRDSLSVRFSQQIKASNYAQGVQIRVNKAAANILAASRDPTRLDTVHYQLDRTIRADDALWWAYDCAHGDIQNLNGDSLLDTAPKAVPIEAANGSTAPVSP